MHRSLIAWHVTIQDVRFVGYEKLRVEYTKWCLKNFYLTVFLLLTRE